MSPVPAIDTSNDEAIAQALAALQDQEGDLGPHQRQDDPLVVRGRPISGRSFPENQSAERSHELSSPPSSLPIPPERSLFQSSSLPHMCVVPCVIGNDGVCVEMMIDTGAQTSVMSLSLVRQLQLESRIDRRHQGIAAGVGQARIVGKMYDVACELGHVEFPMDFMVLDVQEKLLLLGLDLMRRYKCIVDLERNVLIFGGAGGVEVSMLPADQQHIAIRSQLGCPFM